MNEYIEIKKMLDRYYEGESTDADEQYLREYFASDRVTAEWMPYRSIFAYVQYEREHPSASAEFPISMQFIENQKSKTVHHTKRWYYVAAAAASLFTAIFLASEYRPTPQASCTGTYVIINGTCYDDPALVRKYAIETIEQLTKPFDDSSLTDALNFIN